ncbi:hypothetical protein LOTGIDRAFT_157662 [Lottia gigantea]|uniref:RabBD domain-containing protein n=1 Tax=Lottia gigantea TaxID=225164 RepID=V4AVS6_LOTGI|nr:hypothetical protein LOTGIDRAFT_157662 [Lottia gigantea]ESP01473.1 hypothetical protein LOTGIDRAFT_157662 [Lottia gigantea]
MDSELLNLDNLSEEEKLTILKVIKRDEDLRWAKNQQVNHLKNDIHNIRVKSILHDGDDLTKICARCHEPFGFFFNTGETCQQCRFKVCKKCREINLSGAWSCTLCFKQNQLKLLRGDWVKKVGSKKKGKFEHGGDIVKASIRRSLSEAGKKLQNKPAGL